MPLNILSGHQKARLSPRAPLAARGRRSIFKRMLIEIFSDLTCPWCYIGKHRLDRALAMRPRARVEIRWLPFLLNPDMPVGGIERSLYLASKYGGAERARLVLSSIRRAAAQDGLALRQERIARTPNTFDAHCLVRHAERHGKATPVAMALFRAFLEEGRDIGERAVLLDIAEEAGLSRAEAASDLERGKDAIAVRTIEQQARQHGIQAVPCFIFNRRYAVTGAWEPASFLPLIDLAEAETAGGPSVSTSPLSLAHDALAPPSG